MLKKHEELRKKRWLKRNSILDNESYIETLLLSNKFQTYHFMADGYGDESLEITQGLQEFKIEIDKDEGLYKIFMRNKALNKKGKEKYRLVKNYQCDDILELLQYIKSKDTMKMVNVSN